MLAEMKREALQAKGSDGSLCRFCLTLFIKPPSAISRVASEMGTQPRSSPHPPVFAPARNAEVSAGVIARCRAPAKGENVDGKNDG